MRPSSSTSTGPTPVYLDGERLDAAARLAVDPGRARRPALRRLTPAQRLRASVRSPAMQAWILDESPGPYRFGAIDDAAGRRRTTCAVRPVASALNHMDLWLTRGRPTPAAAPRARAATWPAWSRRWATGVERLGRRRRGGREPGGGARSRRSWPTATTRRSAAGFQILGEQRWGGHAERVVVPGPQRGGPPGRARRWEECAAYPLATLTAWRMLQAGPGCAAGERCLIVGIGGGVSTAALAPRRAHGRRGARHLPRRRQARGGARRSGRSRPTTPARTGRCGPRSWSRASGPATWERSIRALAAGGRLVVCGGTSGQKVELDLPRLFFKQIEVIGSTMGGYGEFAEVTRLVEQGLPVSVDSTFGLDVVPRPRWPASRPARSWARSS